MQPSHFRSLVRDLSSYASRAVNLSTSCSLLTHEDELMQIVRLLGRPSQALFYLTTRLAPRQRSTHPASAGFAEDLNGAASSLRAQVAWLRTRAQGEAYEIPRRVVISNPVPQFKKRVGRRRPDGPTGYIPAPRSEESTEILERELQWYAKKAPSLPTIREILYILIEKRGVQPTAEHYEALILGNCDPEHGSVDKVEKILQEMKDEGITISAPIYNAILKVKIAYLHWCISI